MKRSMWIRDELRTHSRRTPPLVAVMSLVNSFHAVPSIFFEIQLKVILPSVPTSSYLSLSFSFQLSAPDLCMHSLLRRACYMPTNICHRPSNQYSETNVMHFLFNILRIKGFYMF
jgi:hypothetical protein